MRFQLDHDWQGNMSTPRAKVGENVKTQLLLLLCGIWIILGLVGHQPWKPLESTSISVVKNLLEGGNYLAPMATAQTTPDTPPLYYLSAAASAKLFSGIFDMHDGARLINAFWMTIVLLMTGMAGRELWGRGVGRHSTFIMMGTIGLVIVAHTLTTEIGGLAATSTGFYALSLAKRRPWRASGLLGLALGIGFLNDGLTPLLILLSVMVVLPIVFKPWRTQSYAVVTAIAVLIALPMIAAWVALMHHQSPQLLDNWWHMNVASIGQNNYNYFVRILIWYAWPAFPLAVWGLWRYRTQLFSKPKFQLILVFFACTLICLGATTASKDINALPLLLPLVALAAGSVEQLKRGAAAALNWFGVTLFGLMGFFIWLGWFALLTGYPAKLNERMQFLSGMHDSHFYWLSFVLAILITLIWLVVCMRAKQTNRSAVTNWAVGMTFGWGLLMTLWLPMIDSAKSYQQMYVSMSKSLPKQFHCMNSLNVGQAQRLLLNYYTDIKLQPFEWTQHLGCELYLIQDERGTGKMQPDSDWKLIWKGKRETDRKESFRLFQRQN